MKKAFFSDESILKLLKLPDLLSVLNALFGFSAILFALSISPLLSATSSVNFKFLENAIILILIAAVIDGIDGIIARKIEQSFLGKYLDSLADLLSFGIAPAIVTYVLLREYEYYYIVSAFCASYIISGILRLARFNAEDSKENFEGLPITGSAVFLASSMLFFIEFGLSFSLFSPLLITLIGILCFLMPSRIKYRNIREYRIAIPVGIVFFVLFFFYLLSLPSIYPSFMLFILSSVYLCSPLTLSFPLKRK